ncbi:MAG: DegT/DnrJ/EryC1/StrS family aminotransferase [Vulcanimicrobiota bacterium]
MKYNSACPYFFPEDIDEILEKYRNILAGHGMLTKGEYVKAFENNFRLFTGTKYTVAINSGTSALEIVLKSIGVGFGDEVIVPVQTFVATASCIVMNNAKVIFCEVNRDFLIDFDDLVKKISSRTKAVIIVHYAGLIHPDIFEIKDYLKKRNIYLIEDAAHAHGASINNIRAGNIGDLGCFSFFSTKVMTTGEGGMITTNNKIYADKCDSLRDIGRDINASVQIYSEIGSNRRMCEFQALLGLYQLKRLEKFVAHRNRIASIYLEILKPLEKKGIISFQHCISDTIHSYWKFVIILDKTEITRENIRIALSKEGINIDWPYEPLLHLQPVFKKLYNTYDGMLKRSEYLAGRHLCIPIHYCLKEEDAIFIGQKLRGIIG